MRANLQREIVAATLGGAGGGAAVLAPITKGLGVFRDTRASLRDAGLLAGIAMRASKTGREYVRVALPRGVMARLHLTPSHSQGGVKPGRPEHMLVPLLTVVPVQGEPRKFFDVRTAAADLARRAGTNVEAATRILLGIERARRRCYELSEEATRWL